MRIFRVESFPTLLLFLILLLSIILNCLTGNDKSGHMVEGQTFTIGECISICELKIGVATFYHCPKLISLFYCRANSYNWKHRMHNMVWQLDNCDSRWIPCCTVWAYHFDYKNWCRSFNKVLKNQVVNICFFASNMPLFIKKIYVVEEWTSVSHHFSPCRILCWKICLKHLLFISNMVMDGNQLWVILLPVEGRLKNFVGESWLYMILYHRWAFLVGWKVVVKVLFGIVWYAIFEIFARI